jgi:hypothetical protein
MKKLRRLAMDRDLILGGGKILKRGVLLSDPKADVAERNLLAKVVPI